MPPNIPESQMERATENQFLHLTFSDYIQLNQRNTVNANELFEKILESDSFESLRSELARLPIEHEADVEFLSNLRELMQPIEAMRNCVAHSRRPSGTLRGNYSRSWPLLEERLDQYLADLQTSL